MENRRLFTSPIVTLSFVSNFLVKAISGTEEEKVFEMGDRGGREGRRRKKRKVKHVEKTFS